MLFERVLQSEIDYSNYRLPGSRIQFRGPKPDFGKPYCTFIGSSETFGKYVAKPYTQLLADGLEFGCANFSGVNAGIDLVMRDTVALKACADARIAVVAVSGAHNLSNRLYRVHPRSNDRFIRASKILQKMYPNMDFTEIHYTRHLLRSLRRADQTKFSIVVQELKKAWVARMTLLIEQINTKTVLLWVANQAPPESAQFNWTGPLGTEPLFIDQDMIDQISPKVTKVVECITSDKAQQRGTKGMVFNTKEAKIAEKMFGPSVHKEIATALLGPLTGMLSG